MNQNRHGNRGNQGRRGSKEGNSSRNRNRGNSRKRRSRSGNRNKPSQQFDFNTPIPEPKQYGVIFFDTLEKAKDAIEQIKTKAAEVEQLNIVLQSEGPIQDEELGNIGKIFAGVAWTTIHTRRVEEGWYDKPQ